MPFSTFIKKWRDKKTSTYGTKQVVVLCDDERDDLTRHTANDKWDDFSGFANGHKISCQM